MWIHALSNVDPPCPSSRRFVRDSGHFDSVAADIPQRQETQIAQSRLNLDDSLPRFELSATRWYDASGGMKSAPGAPDWPEGGTTEDHPTVVLPEPGSEDVGRFYGHLKVLCEDAVREAYGGDRCVITRPGLIVGPGDTTDRFTYYPVRIDRGGEILASVVEVVAARAEAADESGPARGRSGIWSGVDGCADGVRGGNSCRLEGRAGVTPRGVLTANGRPVRTPPRPRCPFRP